MPKKTLCHCGRRFLALGVRRPRGYFFYEIDNKQAGELWKLVTFAGKRLKAFKLFRTRAGYHLIGQLRKEEKWFTVWNYFKRRIKTDFKNSKRHGFVQVLRISAKYDCWGRIVNPAPELVLNYGRLKRIPKKYFLMYWTKKR
jgi:hypothetical protein